MFTFVRKGALVRDRITKSAANGIRIPRLRSAVVVDPARARDALERGARRRRSSPGRLRERGRRGSTPRSSPAPASSATVRPRRMTTTRSREPEDLLELRRDQQDPHSRTRRATRASRRSPASRPTSTPRVGSSAISRRGSQRSMRANSTFLLVAARERADARGRAGAAHLAAVEDRRARRAARRRGGRTPMPLSRSEPRERHVLEHRAGEDQARRPCATRGSAPTPAPRLGRAAAAARGAAARTRPRRETTGLGAEDRAGQLRASGADEACEPDDLAGPHLERRLGDAAGGEVREPRARAARRPPAARFGGNAAVSGRPSIASTSEPRTPPPSAELHDDAPVAQDGDRVREREHLVEEVRDQQDRLPARRTARGRSRAGARCRARSARPTARPSRSPSRRAPAPGGSPPVAARRCAAAPRAWSPTGRSPRRPRASRKRRLSERLPLTKPEPPRLRAEQRRSRRSRASARPKAPGRSARRRGRAPPSACRNATRRAADRHPAAVRRRPRRRSTFPSVDLPAPFSPISACTEPALQLQRDAVERQDASVVLGDVLELDVVSCFPARPLASPSRATPP